ncbi:MAG: RES family NAD+ phosphorylase [Ginsengibacter sp.]
MITYRLATGKYAEDISGTGSKLYGGRWNPVGISMLYTSQYISLALLEVLARMSRHTIPDSYTLISLEIPDVPTAKLNLNKLKKGWEGDLLYSQGIGEDFIKDNQFSCLQVPSAIVAQEHNLLFNPNHKDFKKIKIIKTELLNIDKRLKA